MIRVTRLDGSGLVVNSDLMESVEQTPDTVISFHNGRKLVVREQVDEVVDRVVAFRQRILRGVFGGNLASVTSGTVQNFDFERGEFQ